MGMTYEVVSVSYSEYGISHQDVDKLTGLLRSVSWGFEEELCSTMIIGHCYR